MLACFILFSRPAPTAAYTCQPLLVTVDTWFTPAPRISVGHVVWYGPGVMEGTAAWRQLDLSGYLDGVAMISPADIGKTVWLKRPGYNWDGPFLSVDAARRGDMPTVILERGEVAEVGYRTAQMWGMVVGGRVEKWRYDNVIAYVGDRPPTHYITPVGYVDWWKSIAEYSCHWEPHPYAMRPSSWYIRHKGEPFIMHHSEFVNRYYYKIQPGARDRSLYH